MILDSGSKYPNQRTYVVKLRREAQADALTGRLENVVTGQQREFANGDELLHLLASDIEALAPERSID
jgi:hypothetical protein